MYLAGSDVINARECLRDYWRQGVWTVSSASAERTSGTPPIGGRGAPRGPVSAGSPRSNHRMLHLVAQPGVEVSATGYLAAINATVVSSIRLLNPHSLSYQLETLTRRPETLVSVASKIDERASWLKSLETSGSVL